MLVAELFDLLSQLPVHVVAFALSLLDLGLIHVAKDLGAGGAIWRKHLFDGTGGEVNAGFCHGRVHNFAGAHEGCTAGGIIAHARTLQTLFVFLVALFTGLLVVLDQVHVAQGNLV